LWVYQNIFDDPNKWVFSVIHYPNQKHWVHIGIHASEHTIIVFDPLRNKNNTDIVGSVVRAYANCDFSVALEQGSSEIPKWIKLDVDGQFQPDNHKCGVLSQIRFFHISIKPL
jgi:Ulp1 family protease